MPKYIDADALMNELQKLLDEREKEQRFTGNRGVCVTWNDAIYRIKTAPTIDAVPVVRCKDCIHFDGEKAWCYQDIYVPFDHFYCYYGEREEDAEIH